MPTASVNFTVGQWNRLTFPDRRLMIVEDDLEQQARFAVHFAEVFGGQGRVAVNILSSAIDAFVIQSGQFKAHAIVLDHDVQYGNGSQLILNLRAQDDVVPILTASGIPQNNQHMMLIGATHEFTKDEIIAGKADALLKQILLGEGGDNADG